MFPGAAWGYGRRCDAAPAHDADFGWLLALRVVQGLAGGVGMIVSRALIRDSFAGPAAQRLMAEVTVVSGLGPVIAPILGGRLHVWFGWRGPFLFLTLLGIVLWLACRWGLAESLPIERRQPFHPARLVEAYLGTLAQPAFVMLCFSLGLGAGVVAGWVYRSGTRHALGQALAMAASGLLYGAAPSGSRWSRAGSRVRCA